MPLEYEGRDVAARFFASIFGAGRRFDLVPTRADGQPAFGAYLRASTGIRHGTGLFVPTLTGERICAMKAFGAEIEGAFGGVGLMQTRSDERGHHWWRKDLRATLTAEHGAGRQAAARQPALSVEQPETP